MRRRALIAIGLMAAGCSDDAAGYEAGEEYAGGVGGTAFDSTRTAFSRPFPVLDGVRKDPFFVGNSLFNRNWVTAPSSTEGLDGLGPTFNAASCSSCHFLDGRGRPPVDGAPMESMLIRLSVPGTDLHGGPRGETSYGGQLNPRGILGVPGEGTAVIGWDEVAGRYDDGTPYTLRRPRLTFEGLAFGAMEPGTLTSARVAPVVAGLGLLESIDDADLLAGEDPADADGDGLSGRVNRVWDVGQARAVIGRFGWKAGQPSVRQQSAGAFVGDIGITSSLFPQQDCPPAQIACASAPGGEGAGPAELDDDKLDDVTVYGQTLAAPGRRHVREPDVLAGKARFAAAGCAGCHRPTWITGEGGVIARVPELAGVEIRPYTDLLLHDLGPELADGRPEHQATGDEWRTPPLWGIGLVETVNGHTLFLHDGRARDLAEAILWHGGEASAAQRAFLAMTASERAELLAFLESL